MTDNFPNQTNQGNNLNVVGNPIINLPGCSENNKIRFVDLPDLEVAVYGRDVEAQILADFFP